MKTAATYIHLQPPTTPVFTSTPKSGNSLSILGATSVSVTVDPVVLFSILDHELRRPASQQRAIGALLGVRSEDGSDTVEVKNSFPMVYEANVEGELAVDRDHFNKMHQLHQRVNPKELLVGWYATGPEPDVNTVVLHEDFFGAEVSQEPSVHLVVDTLFSSIEEASMKAYVAQPLGIPGDEENDGRAFSQVPCQMQMSDVDKATLNLVSKAATNLETRETPIEADIMALEECVTKLKNVVDVLAKYAQDVAAGNVAANPAVGRFIMDAISEVPKLDKDEFDKIFSKKLQDNIMVAYLANLTKAQLSLADKLYTIA